MSCLKIKSLLLGNTRKWSGSCSSNLPPNPCTAAGVIQLGLSYSLQQIN